MEWGFNLIDVAQGFLVVIASLLGAIGLRKGLNNPSSGKSVEVSAEVAGALVDSSSVRKLTASIDAYAVEVHNTRQALYITNSNMEELADQIRELRATLQRLGDVLITRK